MVGHIESALFKSEVNRCYETSTQTPAGTYSTDLVVGLDGIDKDNVIPVLIKVLRKEHLGSKPTCPPIRDWCVALPAFHDLHC